MFKRFIVFDALFTPQLIKLLYVLGEIGIIVSAIMLIATPNEPPEASATDKAFMHKFHEFQAKVDKIKDMVPGLNVIEKNWLAGLIFLIIATLAFRILCEIVIAIFKMNEHLDEMKGKLGTGDKKV